MTAVERVLAFDGALWLRLEEGGYVMEYKAASPGEAAPLEAQMLRLEPAHLGPDTAAAAGSSSSVGGLLRRGGGGAGVASLPPPRRALPRRSSCRRGEEGCLIDLPGSVAEALSGPDSVAHLVVLSSDFSEYLDLGLPPSEETRAFLEQLREASGGGESFLQSAVGENMPIAFLHTTELGEEQGTPSGRRFCYSLVAVAGLGGSSLRPELIRGSLAQMVRHCAAHGIERVAMPRLGSFHGARWGGASGLAHHDHRAHAHAAAALPARGPQQSWEWASVRKILSDALAGSEGGVSFLVCHGDHVREKRG